jgi:hypothetical protein
MNRRLTNVLRAFVVVTFCFNAADDCLGRDILFRRASRNYDEKGQLGVVYRRELETRMFTHPTWLVRLYCSGDGPDIDETIEIYSNADGSHWIEHRRATPSLSRFIRERILHSENFDLKERLNAVHITRCHVALPSNVASEIEHLWQTMLSRLPPEPKDSTTHTVYLNAPVFLAFAHENSSVTTGTVANAGYDTSTYRTFVDIVDNLTNLCEKDARTREGMLEKLSDKVRDLERRLANQR